MTDAQMRKIQEQTMLDLFASLVLAMRQAQRDRDLAPRHKQTLERVLKLESQVDKWLVERSMGMQK